MPLLTVPACKPKDFSMALEKEMETYFAELPKLVANKDEGKFIVIHDGQVLGVFGTYEDALKIGYEKCRLQPFLVKKIAGVEQSQHFSRDLHFECHT
jgi:hypothetical protein